MGKRERTIAATAAAGSAAVTSPINSLDDGCLMHIFSFLSPIPDRHNTALVCHRWRYLACHPRHWLRIESSIKSLAEPGVYSTLEAAISAARPGDTILISAGGNHIAHNIQIMKPLCLIGGGELPDDTVLTCLRGSESALEFFSTCKVANLTVRAELGCCLLHRSGRLMVEGCVLQCEENPLDYLSFPIVSTAPECNGFTPLALKGKGSCSVGTDSVIVSNTRIEGGAKAVSTNGNLVLQHVRAIYASTSIFFWFEVGARYGKWRRDEQCNANIDISLFTRKQIARDLPFGWSSQGTASRCLEFGWRCPKCSFM